MVLCFENTRPDTKLSVLAKVTTKITESKKKAGHLQHYVESGDESRRHRYDDDSSRLNAALCSEGVPGHETFYV
jgi:hypothetical protein